MKIQTQDLKGPALRWAVAKCMGFDTRNTHLVEFDDEEPFTCCADDDEHARDQAMDSYPEASITQIIKLMAFEPDLNPEQAQMALAHRNIEQYSYPMAYGEIGFAAKAQGQRMYGETSTIAALRCLVAIELGTEIVVPDDMVEAEEETMSAPAP